MAKKLVIFRNERSTFEVHGEQERPPQTFVGGISLDLPRLKTELLQHGCVNGPVVGHESILNYPTTAVEYRQDDYFKFTVWRGPDLGCFALRVTDEERQDDGTYRLVREKRALHVTLNH